MSLKETLVRHNFHFSKKYGQNFLTDSNLLDAIVEDSGVGPQDTVIEIGAGAGTLTAALARHAKRVISYEIDTTLKPVLDETLADYRNVQLVFKDFMAEDVGYLQRNFAHCKVVANLPYYVTTPILMRLVEEGIGDSITVTIQQEVADRLIAAPNTKDYGCITVKINLIGSAYQTRRLSRQLFYPVPNVDSAVVRVDRVEGKYPPEQCALAGKLARYAFAMRRKTLVNNLMAALGAGRAEVETLVQQTGLALNVRGEALSAAQYVALADAILAKMQPRNL